MGGAPLALAFTAGMLASINPCGFAMLPAYLSYFVGLEDDVAGTAASRGAPIAAAGRAVAVAAAMTSGFVVVFGVMGLVISQVSTRVQEHLPWVTMLIGLALLAMGVAALFGRTVTLRLPHLAPDTSSRELSSMFVFGVSYALSSLSCTVAPFLAATSSTFRNDGVAAGTATFVTYGLGMGAIVGLLTVAVALARTGVVQRFRRVLRHVHLLSGVLMVVAGAYMAWYGWYEVRLQREIVDDPVVDRALAVNGWLVDALLRIGTSTLGVLAAVAVGAVVLAALGRRRAERRGAPPAPPDDEDASPGSAPGGGDAATVTAR